MSEFTCEGCGKRMENKRARYCLKIQLFAAPEVELDEADMQADHRKEMEEMNEKLASLDAKKLEEDVYICYDLNICRSCRNKFSQRIKCKEFI